MYSEAVALLSLMMSLLRLNQYNSKQCNSSRTTDMFEGNRLESGVRVVGEIFERWISCLLVATRA